MKQILFFCSFLIPFTFFSQCYQIGDIGPAGGIVFYDQGSNTNGWRYLEVCPLDFNTVSSGWGCYCTNFPSLSTAIGAGQQNSNTVLGSSCEGNAFQFCENLNYGGYSDWFLPSKDELQAIRNNLTPLNLGNFTPNIFYWSSSSAPYGSCGIDGGAWVLTFNTNSMIPEYRPGYQGQGMVRAIRAISDLPSSSVSVTVFNDLDQNCINNGEIGVEGFHIILQPGNIVSTTNSNGNAIFQNLPDGTYTIQVDTNNLSWSTNCSVSQNITISNGVSGCVKFGFKNTNPCISPDVSIFAPYLRRCSSHPLPIFVSACNLSTATQIMNSAVVQVVLDETIFDITGCDYPISQIGIDTFEINIGNIIPGECVNFQIDAYVTCEPEMSQTVCMEANLLPVSPCMVYSNSNSQDINTNSPGTLGGLPLPCTLPWDQSSLSVDGWCENDSIYFTVTNTGSFGGGDMECYAPVWVTVDGIVTFTDSILLQGGQTITYGFLGNGATWILNASQHPLHPGNSHPNAHVEACGDISNWTPGLVNDFPLDDADPIIDIFCGQIVGSYDPNDKTGYPIGQGPQKYIQPNQQLQYVVRFQNTGTDTAFLVVVRDTLDFDLNIFTVVPGVASHPYTFKMYGPRVLEWTFENIDLVDSTTNVDASQGFLTFHVEQNPNLLPGTEITNEADIYFDENPPIITNQTLHTIFEGFVNVAGLEEISKKETDLLVFPNPSNGKFTLQSQYILEGQYGIYNQQGKLIKVGKLTGNNTEIELKGQNGMFYILLNEGVVKVQVIE